MKEYVYFNRKGAEKGYFTHFLVFYLLQRLALNTIKVDTEWIIITTYSNMAKEYGLKLLQTKKYIKELTDREYITKSKCGNRLKIVIKDSDLVKFP